jgi:hypothetical protein
VNQVTQRGKSSRPFGEGELAPHSIRVGSRERSGRRSTVKSMKDDAVSYRT